MDGDEIHVQVDGQIFPGTLHARLSARNALCITHLGDTGNLFCKLNEFISHSIDGILDLYHEGTLHGGSDPMGQVTAGDGVTDANDVANLSLDETKLVYCILVSLKCSIIEWTKRKDERGTG